LISRQFDRCAAGAAVRIVCRTQYLEGKTRFDMSLDRRDLAFAQDVHNAMGIFNVKLFFIDHCGIR